MFVVPTTKQPHNHMGERKPDANGSTILRFFFFDFRNPVDLTSAIFSPFSGCDFSTQVGDITTGGRAS